LLPGAPGSEDALVADDQQGRGEQHQRGQAHEAAPAAADVAGGGVLGGGEAAFGAGAAGVGAAVRGDDKHNEANGEDNRDGTSGNRSWNCGAEGPTSDPDILTLRARQIWSFIQAPPSTAIGIAEAA
jgi:hypothetical protein